MEAARATEALTALRAAVDQLLSAGLCGLSSTELTALVADLEVERRRLESVDQRTLAEVSERGVAGEYARTSAADLLVDLLRVSPAEAKARVARARDIGPRRAMTGEPMPPILALVAAAMSAGEISAAHAGVITKCLERIPGRIAHEVVPVAEQLLVEAARHEHPGALATTAALLLARVDPDGAEPRDEELARRRDFKLVKRRDGSSLPRGLFDPETTAAWEAILDSLSAPVPAEDGMADERSAGQRRHDAMAGTTISELGAGIGIAISGHGSPFSVQQLLDMACEAEVIPVIFNEAGGILAYGRTRRLASPGQRLALAARDGGCCFPACDRPAAWTEVHHVLPWIEYGYTDLDNMCLLCRYHHREFEKRGWKVQMTDGMPEWIPPPWLDPDQRPRRNAAHHLTELEFLSSG